MSPPPAPFFINFGATGGGSDCTTIQYDDGSIGTSPAPTWQINKAYTSGSWGYVDSGSTISLVDGTTGNPSTADILFDCYLETRSLVTLSIRLDDTLIQGAWGDVYGLQRAEQLSRNL